MSPESTPDNIRKLGPNEVFVFGSNYQGKHGAGAAKLALQKFGAINGQGMGLMGQSYGIATKGHKLDTLSLFQIEVQVMRFIIFATKNPQLKFYVTQIGCGLAGYSPKDIAPLFKDKFGTDLPPNIILPKVFKKYLVKT